MIKLKRKSLKMYMNKQLTEILRESNLPYNIEIASYENHGDVGKGFPSYVLTKI